MCSRIFSFESEWIAVNRPVYIFFYNTRWSHLKAADVKVKILKNNNIGSPYFNNWSWKCMFCFPLLTFCTLNVVFFFTDLQISQFYMEFATFTNLLAMWFLDIYTSCPQKLHKLKNKYTAVFCSAVHYIKFCLCKSFYKGYLFNEMIKGN